MSLIMSAAGPSYYSKIKESRDDRQFYDLIQEKLRLDNPIPATFSGRYVIMTDGLPYSVKFD